MENELNDAQTTGAVETEALTLDEKARVEIAREKEAGPVENLQNVTEPHVDAEVRAQDDVMSWLPGTIHGANMTTRDFRRGMEAITAAEKQHGVDVFDREAKWAGNNYERQAFLLKQAASGVQTRMSQQELDGVGVQIAARQRIKQLEAEGGAGTEAYKRNMAEITRLWQIESGGTPLVGKGLRRV